jgi:hypothetical protein
MNEHDQFITYDWFVKQTDAQNALMCIRARKCIGISAFSLLISIVSILLAALK